MWTLSPTHTGRIKASVFEVDPKVLSRNAPESIGESKHFTIASSLRGEVTATPTKIAAYLIEKIGSAASGYFHPSLWLSESHELLVAKGLDRIEARGAQGGIKSCGKTDENCKTDSKKDEPPGDGRK